MGEAGEMHWTYIGQAERGERRRTSACRRIRYHFATPP